MGQDDEAVDEAVDEQAEPEWRRANRALWDELAQLHPTTELYDLPAVVKGRDDLRPWEDAELGSLEGRDLIHLQCHIGTDTVALARRGARVVGLDFSAEGLAVAERLAKECELALEWVCADVYDAADAVAGRTFDVVYTGFGALGWLPDLRPWATAVHDLLHPGGFLYVTEIHPMWMALVEDGRRMCQDAIDAELACYDEDGSYAAPEAHLDNTVSFERLHSISDLLSSLLDAGLQLELFHEFDVTPAPTPWLEQGDDGLFHFPEGEARFPVAYSLRARR
jgi:2-polyprenyl-3-methyl-5-hydroxy-6-metoxy-1,4-benzoquinol methylase